MSRRQKQLTIIIPIIVLLGYVTFPWWAKPIITGQLPENISLQQINIGYPGLQGLTIKQLHLQSNEMELEVNQLTTDYRLKSLAAESLSFSLKKAPDNESASPPVKVSLPRLNLAQLLASLPFSRLSVEKLSLAVNSHQFELKNLQVNFETKTDIEAQFLMTDDVVFKNPINLNLSLKARSDTAEVKLTTKNQTLLTAHYKSAEKERGFSLIFSSDAIGLIAEKLEQIKLSALDRFKADGTLTVNLVQDKESENLQSEFQFQGQVMLPQLSGDYINLLVNSTSNDNQFPWTLKTKVQLENLEIVRITPYKTDVSQADIHLEAELTIEEKAIFIRQPVLEAKIGEIRFDQFNSTLKNLNFRSHISSIQLNPPDLNDVSIKTRLIGVTAYFNDSKKQLSIETDIKGHFDVNNLAIDRVDLANISGQLEVVPVKASPWSPSFDSRVYIAINGIDQAFSRGSVDLKVEDEGGHFSDIDYDKLISELTLDLDKENIKGKGSVELNEFMVAPLEIHYNKAKQFLKVNLPRNNLDLALINQLIAEFTTEKMPEVEFQAGELIHQAEVSYQNKFPLSESQVSKKIIPLKKTKQQRAASVNSSIELNNAEIMLGKNQAVNVNLKSSLTSFDPVKVRSILTSEKISFASGLEMKELEANFRMGERNLISFENLTSKLLGGTVNSQRLIVEQGKILPSEILINKMSLGELILFLNMESLFGEGDVNLKLPIRNEGDKIVIENAEFKNVGEGIIKYNSRIPGAGSDNVAVKALENFHYTELDGTFNYDKNGLYRIKIHLLGKNPELYNGHPVDFVLNISGNLPGLFKSLFLSGSFEESIINSVKANTE